MSMGAEKWSSSVPAGVERGSTLAAALVRILVLVTFFSGIVNLIHLRNVYLATVMIDAIVLLLAFASAVRIIAKDRPVRLPVWAQVLTLFILTYAILAFISPEPSSVALTNFRSVAGYASISLAILLFIGESQARQILRLAMRCSMALAGFGIAQYLFRGTLPAILVSSRDTEAFGYYQTDVLRANGLIGNTIVFATILLIFFAIHSAKLAEKPSWTTAFATLVLGLGLVCTYSRIAIVGIPIVLFLSVILVFARSRMRHGFALALGVLCVVFIVVWAMWPTIDPYLSDSFVYRGIFMGGNAAVQGSNAGHTRDIQVGKEAFMRSPVFGQGVGTQQLGSSYSATHPVLTDGALWARLAEGGIFLTGFYLVVMIAIVNMLWTRLTTREVGYLAAGLLAFASYEFLFAIVYNSGFFGKGPFVMFWILVGVAATQLPAQSCAKEAKEEDLFERRSRSQSTPLRGPGRRPDPSRSIRIRNPVTPGDAGI